MLTPALALLAALPAAPASDFVAVDISDPGAVTCSLPRVDDATVALVLSAPPGGTFWMRQSDFATRLEGEIELEDEHGTVTVAAGVRRTTASVSFSAPAGVSGGETFSVLENEVDLGVHLTIVPPPDASTSTDAALLDATPTAPVSTECPEKFCSDTGDVPRVATVDVTYEGGPAILDVAATDPEVDLVDDTPRSVDSMLLTHVDAPTTIHVLAGPGRSQSVPVDVHVRLSSPVDRRVVAEALLPLTGIDAPPDGTPPPPCEQQRRLPPSRCFQSGCQVECPPIALALLVGLRASRLRRLRGAGRSTR